MSKEGRISLNEAARRAGVSPATLTRWADEKIVPVRKGRWTAAAAAQARIVARMRERGHSLEELKEAGKEGKLSFGMAEDIFADDSERFDLETASAETGLSVELLERVMVVLGTPAEREPSLSARDIEAMKRMGDVVEAGLPVEALLQLTRVYAQAVRRIADAEVRLFHLFVHEPMIRDGLGELEMAEELGADGAVVAIADEDRIRRRMRQVTVRLDMGHQPGEFGRHRSDRGCLFRSGLSQGEGRRHAAVALLRLARERRNSGSRREAGAGSGCCGAGLSTAAISASIWASQRLVWSQELCCEATPRV